MSAETRRRVLAAAAALAVIGGVALFNRVVVRSGPAAGGLLVLSSSFAIAVVAAIGAEWPRSRGRAVPLTAAAALVSTVVTFAHTPREVPRDAFWIVAEVLALLTLLVLVVRWAPVRGAVVAGGLAAAATMATVWRITVPSSSPDTPEVIGALLNWAFGAAAAAALGMYLRTLDASRSRMILDARRAQRLELARDLHDFVAHDVTGIVVQAQAAHVVARRAPEEAVAALQRIEEAGLRALGSLDHTVHMLGDLSGAKERYGATATERAEGALESRTFGLEDVLALVGRFAATDLRPIRLHVDTGLEPPIPPVVASTAYRVILEALTNVRRHAPAAARVDVSITPGDCATGAALTVRVTNDAAAESSPALTSRGADVSRGGRGVTQLAERVALIGGTLAAGALDPGGTGGWHVTAVLPLRGVARS